MSNSQEQVSVYTLWGTPHSLYTGKMRSYLLKKGIAFRERIPAHPEFQQRILPAIGMFVVPVLETPAGEIIQDTTEIIELLEARAPARPMVPQTPVQRVVALLLDGFGSAGLLPPAMHYRWSYRAQQENFLRAEFGRAVHSGPNREERLAAGAQLMDYFNGMLPPLGVNPATIPATEAAYEALLDALDIHFQHYPYLLGGHPSVADFGMMAPLFAHLGRDPYPANLMKDRAPNVYRWTERMNLPGIADPEFPDCPETWLAGDAIAPTLEPVLALLFQDWGAPLTADAAAFNAWSDGLPAGSLVHIDAERKVHPTIGMVEYPWRGCTVQRASAPHGLWLFARAQAAAEGLSGDARERLADLVRRNGGDAVMALRCTRRMKRERCVLVLQ
jgi:glutathione S-transferase